MLTRKLHFILFSILSTIAFSSSAVIDNAQYLSQLQNQITETQLWKKTEWKNLLHYEIDGQDYKSHVIDKRFFFSKDGKNNPETELIETLSAMFLPAESAATLDEHPQCRFPARFNWLKTSLKINTTLLPDVACPSYEKWRNENASGKITMVFPAYHLNSPSSMFGHTLLRIDPPNGSTDWLSLAVNFGANANDGDNSIVYAFRGLAGGYPGTFVTHPYYKKIQEYGRIEHRDIWEYELNLSPDEVNRLIAHLWELQEINFDYYFFDENCSYRLLELLEVARPSVELTDEFSITAIPVDTVRAIDNAKMITHVKYRPAPVTKLEYRLSKIPESQRDMVLQLSEDKHVLESQSFLNLPIKDQRNIVDMTYNYLQYKNTDKERDPVLAKYRFKLLKQLNTYPAELNESVQLPRPVPPEKSHKSERVTFALGNRLNNHYAELGLRFAFHDLEDNKDGFLQGAQINIGTIKIRAEDNVGIRIHRLDFVDIFSLTPRDDFFKPLSWKVYTGLEQQFTKNKDQLTYHVTGGGGGSWDIAKNHRVYALGIARLEINKQLKNTLEPAIGFTSGLLSHFKNTTAHLEVSGEQFEDSVYRLRVQYTQNIVFSTNHSIKLFAKHQWQENDVEFSDVNLSYQYYY